jgi:hypothetical protein
MCVSNAPANFNGTIIYSGISGDSHVLGYQNQMQNLSSGPNAMILHFPAKVKMTQANVLVTENCPNILKNMKEAIESNQPVMRSFSMTEAKSVQVFDSGIYTIILADDARSIPSVLHLVPANKRPSLNTQLFTFYAEQFPECQIALCCFDSKDVVKSDPLIWVYSPIDVNTFHLPGLDCHTGGIPNNDYVNRDHWLIFGSDKGEIVYYTDNIPTATKKFLPGKVIGFNLNSESRNGDFKVPVKSLAKGYPEINIKF